MQIRRAYIGLSSPIFYDFGNEAEKVYKNQYTSPNPILDGPLGLLLFFDELWFFSRALCPQNMRALQYVKFVDEEGLLDGFDFDLDSKASDVFDKEDIEYQRKGFKIYEETLDIQGVNWWGPGARIDNHSHPIKSPYLNSKWHLAGNSMHAERVIFDLAVANYIGRSFEYISNSFTDRLLFGNHIQKELSTPDFRVGEKILLIKDIPNFQTIDGPYHPCIEELRTHGCLPHFRNWIAQNAKELSAKEIEEARLEVEAILRETVRTTLFKYFDPKHEAKSLGKTFLGWGLDFVAFPGISKLWKMFDARSEHIKKENIRWQGFVLDAQSILSKERI